MNDKTVKHKILLVDDEPNITSSLQRLLRKDNYSILTATSGEEGLQVLESEAIDLIVSDMRMPNMDGAEFLTKAKAVNEKAIRILLTGYSDMNSTVSAINQAEIFRYISKPWNDDDFRLTIRRGLELKNLESERERLEALTSKQNTELKTLNQSLESKVEFRTKKLREMMEELSTSNDEIKKNYLYIIKTLSSLTDLRGGHLEGHSRRVADNARKVANLMSLSNDEAQDVFFGALLHDIGKIGLSDDILSKPQSILTQTELQQKKKHSVWGEGLLIGMEKFQVVAKIIRHHHENFDGTGYPDQLSGENIPIGARILAIASDYDALRSGALFQKKYSLEEAIQYLNNHRKSFYDPVIVATFISLFKKEKQEVKVKGKSRKALFTYQLKPGLELAKDLMTSERMLLLPKGHVLTADVIQRLVHHEKTLQEVFKVYVKINLIREGKKT